MTCMKVDGEGDDVFYLDLLKAVGISNGSTTRHVNLGMRNAGNQQWALHGWRVVLFKRAASVHGFMLDGPFGYGKAAISGRWLSPDVEGATKMLIECSGY